LAAVDLTGWDSELGLGLMFIHQPARPKRRAQNKRP